MSASVEHDAVFIFGGLEPGTRLELSVDYHSDDGSEGLSLGVSAQTARSTGIVRFVTDYLEITNGTMKPGEISAWAHLPGPFNEPPAQTTEGPAAITFHYPAEPVS